VAENPARGGDVRRPHAVADDEDDVLRLRRGGDTAGDEDQEDEAPHQRVFEKSNGDSSPNGSSLCPVTVSFASISSLAISEVDWMPESLRRNSSGFEARRSASSRVI